MPETQNSFAKIVAATTNTSWTHAYTAGDFVVIVALSQPTDDKTDTLHATGKQIVNNLEAEFFTLEKKDLKHIQQAIATACVEKPDNISISLCAGYRKDTILYLFLYGAGTIFIKRGSSSGILLEKKREADTALSAQNVLATSGKIEDHDSLIFATEAFVTQAETKAIVTAFNTTGSPTKLKDIFSPTIEEKDAPAAGAIIVQYSLGENKAEAKEEETKEVDETPEEAESLTTTEKAEEENNQEETTIHHEEKTKRRFNSLPPLLARLPKFSKSHLNMNHRRKLALTLVIILVAVLGISIAYHFKQKNQQQTQAAFNQIYPPAQKAYDEGQSLKTLNASLAQEDFLKAQKILNDGKSKFANGSKEGQQIDALLAQVNQEIMPTQSVTPSAVTSADASSSPMLEAEKDNNAQFSTQDDSNVYIISSKAITSIDKATSKSKDLVTNDGDWKSITGFGTYLGNFYILDPSAGILKYTPTDSGYGKLNYFTGSSPDLSNAVSLTIDGSIWVLKKTGEIDKYTKGAADTFTIQGLSQLFNNPTRIFTTADINSVYVLDKGNQRIVKLAKDGTFQAQYAAPQLKDAQDFEVQESNKKIIFLEQGKLWQISL